MLLSFDSPAKTVLIFNLLLQAASHTPEEDSVILSSICHIIANVTVEQVIATLISRRLIKHTNKVLFSKIDFKTICFKYQQTKSVILFNICSSKRWRILTTASTSADFALTGVVYKATFRPVGPRPGEKAQLHNLTFTRPTGWRGLCSCQLEICQPSPVQQGSLEEGIIGNQDHPVALQLSILGT